MTNLKQCTMKAGEVLGAVGIFKLEKSLWGFFLFLITVHCTNQAWKPQTQKALCDQVVMAAQNTLKAKQMKKHFQQFTVQISYRCMTYRGIPIFKKGCGLRE